MGLAMLVLSGGLLYWFGLITNQWAALSIGLVALGLSFVVMLSVGGIDPLGIPFLLAAGLLVFGLKHYPIPFWQVIGWTLFIVLALALGFRVFPFFTPVETVQTVEHGFRFPPEKVVLMLLVPTMVWCLGLFTKTRETGNIPIIPGWSRWLF
ncbi:MAG: hypothetical protein R3F37_21165 [Candidatus Competibacteraceae bacterium]